MALTPAQRAKLETFFRASSFHSRGWIITDLDGTCVHEEHGHLTLPKSVQSGLSRAYQLGRPVVINTLRFPLSVMRTFGSQWHKLANAEIPTVLMNGSQLGYMTCEEGQEFTYREIAAFPLHRDELEAVLSKLEKLSEAGVEDMLVFYYPRDWTKGELIWTPTKERVETVRAKYLSASQVFCSSLEGLARKLLAEEICMVFLLLDMAEDKLMAYQHTKRSNFFTHRGVDKLSGARKIASALNLELGHALGAGDTEMDSFLKEVGLPVHVGPLRLPFHHKHEPMKVASSAELGELLYQLVSMEKEAA